MILSSEYMLTDKDGILGETANKRLTDCQRSVSHSARNKVS